MNELRTLILGLGNDVLMDDGIGPRLVNDIQKSFNKSRYSKPETLNPEPASGIHFENIFMGGLGILEFIQGYETVIIIDAIKTKDGVPGTVSYYTPADFRETTHLSSQHDASFLTALAFGEKLGFVIPKKIHIIAIEIIEDRTFGNEFTEPLQEKYDEILKQVTKHVQSLIT
jgi:hydrogenase maturation protease